MGSVFRKMTTRPLPGMAERFTRRRKVTTRLADGTKCVEHVTEPCARWKDANGKTKVALLTTGTDETARVRQESGTYFAKYRDHDGTVRVVPTGCRDETNAKQFLADLEKQADRVRAGVVTARELAVSGQMSDPIERHIADYLSTLCGDSHRGHTERYVRRLAKDCHWQCLDEFRRDDLELWLAEQTRQGRSARSRNAYHVAVVSFANWLVRAERMRTNPFAKIAKVDVELDRRRTGEARVPPRSSGSPVPRRTRQDGRRSSRAQETTGKASPLPAAHWTRQGVSLVFPGRDRTTAERVRELKVGNLFLDGDRPGLDLPPALTKAKERQYVPLRPDLAERLRRQVKGRGFADLVFSIPADILRRFKADCKRAGIPFTDDRGLMIDIHALRMSFIDGLVKAGTHPRIVQELARHSDISITMKYYTDVRVHDLHAAIAAVAPVVGEPVAPAVAPTGVNSVQPELSDPESLVLPLH